MTRRSSRPVQGLARDPNVIQLFVRGRDSRWRYFCEHPTENALSFALRMARMRGYDILMQYCSGYERLVTPMFPKPRRASSKMRGQKRRLGRKTYRRHVR